jgi:hypothetical protein
MGLFASIAVNKTTGICDGIYNEYEYSEVFSASFFLEEFSILLRGSGH